MRITILLKKIIRIICLILAINLAFSQNAIILHGGGDSFSVDFQTQHLSPALKCDDISGIQYKDIGRIEIALQANLNMLVKKVGIENLDTEVFTSHSIFDPADMHFFFGEKKDLPNGYFAVMCRITDKISDDPRTYYAVFSLRRYKLIGFPIYVYTEKEYKRFEETLSSSFLTKKVLPAREEQDLVEIERYIYNNEMVIDKFIRRQLEEGEFAEIEGRAKKLGWDEKYKDRKKPTSYWPEVYLDYISSCIGDYLEFMGTSVAKAFAGKNLVVIKIPVGGYPRILERGGVIRVVSHTSANSVYIFLEKPFYNVLDRESNKRRSLDSFDPGVVDFNGEQAESILQGLLSTILHEIGASYGLPFYVVDKVDPEETKKRKGKRLSMLYNRMFPGLVNFDFKVTREKILTSMPELEKLGGEQADLNDIFGRDYAASSIKHRGVHLDKFQKGFIS